MRAVPRELLSRVVSGVFLFICLLWLPAPKTLTAAL